jgi:GNAT superfamily N-acetyltransferase
MGRRSNKGVAQGKLGVWEAHPLTPKRWNDLETLFGERGACAGCWCMWWRLAGPEFKEHRGQANKASFRRIVKSGEVPGIIGYVDAQPAGWCAIAPREAYKRLQEERVRIFKKLDEKPVWTVTCFFVVRSFRGQGVMKKLLQAAVEYAGKQGAKIIEGYPVDTQGTRKSGNALYTGEASVFRKVGFVEVLRRAEARPIMRYFVET